MSDPIYVAIAERTAFKPEFSYLESVSACKILGVFRSTSEANHCVRTNAGKGFAKAYKRQMGETWLPGTWDDRDGLLTIYNLDLEECTLNARVERHQLAASRLPMAAPETPGKKRQRDETKLPPAAEPKTEATYTTEFRMEDSDGNILENRSFTSRTRKAADAMALSLGEDHLMYETNFYRSDNGLLMLEGADVHDGRLYISTTEKPHPASDEADNKRQRESEPEASYTVHLRLMAWDDMVYRAFEERDQTFTAPGKADACVRRLAAQYGFKKKKDFGKYQGRVAVLGQKCKGGRLWIDITTGPHPLPTAPPGYIVKYRKEDARSGDEEAAEKFEFPTIEAANKKFVEIAEEYGLVQEDFAAAVDVRGGLLALEGKEIDSEYGSGFLLMKVGRMTPRV